MTELDRLLELALRATPGPWFWTDEDGDFQMRCLSPGILVIDNTPGSGGPWGDEIDQANAAYIAAASPDRVKALVMRLKRAEEALRPFAKFDMSGFDGIVLEVVPSDPRNPAPRVEPILADYFRRAAAYFNPAGEGE